MKNDVCEHDGAPTSFSVGPNKLSGRSALYMRDAHFARICCGIPRLRHRIPLLLEEVEASKDAMYFVSELKGARAIPSSAVITFVLDIVRRKISALHHAKQTADGCARRERSQEKLWKRSLSHHARPTHSPRPAPQTQVSCTMTRVARPCPKRYPSAFGEPSTSQPSSTNTKMTA